MAFEGLEKATRLLSNPAEVENLIIKAAEKLEAEIVKFNTSQLEVGQLADGDPTQEYASISYTNYKASIGSKSVPNMDLKLTGAFHAGFKIDFKPDGLEIYSTDSKATDLENRYTSEIYGLTVQNANKTGELISDTFIKLISDEITG